ncbi:MAG: RdgB/HAM1 family non-canonical purine NTP pyrophosphatase [Steroidobacteraceae bacterium]|nr:RdgB/HAM1 family non-canonical purine NTP pyrophosphatase [Steroidobacteraceae bacterium]
MSERRVILATGNPGKFRQFSELLDNTGITLLRQSDFGIEPPEETGSTFLENALIKARNAAAITGLPAIADDSGIEVDALDGRPGLYSARYAGANASDCQNLEKMLRELASVPPERRGARYRSVIVFVTDAADPAPLIGEGTWEGSIATAPRGSEGFGYDPIFLPRGETRTAAEMSAAERNPRSHRGQASRQFLERFGTRG